MNRTQLLERYRFTLELRRLAPGTIQIYLRWLNAFLDYIQFDDFSDSSRITIFDAQDYLHYLLDDEQPHPKYADRTYNQAVYALRQLFEPVLLIPVSKLQLPHLRPPRSDKQWFTGEQVRQMLRQCDDLTLAAAISLGFGCGLRINEITNLKFGNIFKGSHSISISVSKGNVKRTVPYSKGLSTYLNDYCRTIPEERRTPDDYVIQEKKSGNRVRNTVLTQQFAKFIQTLEFFLPYQTFHSLRHSFATECALSGVPINVIQGWMGHKSMATTCTYVHVPILTEYPMPDLLEDKEGEKNND